MTPSDWIAVASLAVAAASLALAAFTVWITLREQRKAREAMEAEERRRQVGPAIAATRGLLSDSQPDAVLLNASRDETPAKLEELVQAWRERVREPLLALASTAPTQRQRDAAEQLVKLTGSALGQVRWAVHDLFDSEMPVLEARNRALRTHQCAEKTARALASMFAGGPEIDPPDLRDAVTGEIAYDPLAEAFAEVYGGESTQASEAVQRLSAGNESDRGDDS